MNSSESNNDETVIANSSKQADETVIRSDLNSDLYSDETVVKTVTNTDWSNTSSDSLTIGSTLQKRFVLKDILGSGGMGTVYLATDLRRQEAHDQQPDVAIKVLNEEFRTDPELFIALQRETKKSQMLAHPNIVTVYDFDRDGHNVFMVMELLTGKSLGQFIKDDCTAGLPFKNAWHIIKGLALALAYAHKKNIIHSDFKPGNIFITDEDEVKILDFGIACAAVRSDLQNEETVFNARDLGALTPAYASLEMIQGKQPDPADDVYALACVSYELLSGKHPFGKLSAEKAQEVKLEVPTINGLDRRQRTALVHALVFDRENRTATVSDFLDEIEPKSILPKVFGVIAGLAILAAVGGYYYLADELQSVDDSLIELSKEQQLAVTDFLELAQIHFEVGYLTAPSGSNASWAFKQVLAIDPYNKDAIKGLNNIADLIAQQATDLYRSGKNKASLAKIEEGLEAVPKHKNLLELKDLVLESGL